MRLFIDKYLNFLQRLDKAILVWQSMIHINRSHHLVFYRDILNFYDYFANVFHFLSGLLSLICSRLQSIWWLYEIIFRLAVFLHSMFSDLPIWGINHSCSMKVSSYVSQDLLHFPQNCKASPFISSQRALSLDICSHFP